MRIYASFCVLLVTFSTALNAAEPDATALELTTKYGWGDLPVERKSGIEYLKRENMVVEARLMNPKNFSRPMGEWDELVLRKRLKMPNVDPTGQTVEQFTLIKKLKLPSGRTTVLSKTLDNEDLLTRQQAFGTTNEALGDAFKAAAGSIEIFGTAIDAEIAKSAFGGDPRFDGADGSRTLGWMLNGGSDSPAGLLHEGCETLADVDYSETAAVGASPISKRYSASMFLAGGACMFQAIGERIAAGPQKADPTDQSYAALERGIDALGSSLGDDLKFYGFEGPDNDRIAVIGVGGLDMEHSLPQGGKVTINEIRKGIDANAYVPRFLAFYGTLQQPKQTAAVNWRTDWKDYDGVPGTALYEPRRQVLAMSGIGGMLSDTDRKKMADAEKQLAKFEQQLASMPANQRAMTERMIGPQIEQFRKMAKGGGVEFEMLTTAIEVNPNLIDPNNSLAKLGGEDGRELLVKQIQKDLDALGYDPGPMSGELTPQTAAAIRRFEGDHGMPMTGEATLELANVLAISVLAQG